MKHFLRSAALPFSGLTFVFLGVALSTAWARDQDPFARIKFKARSSLTITIPDDLKTTDPLLAEDEFTSELLYQVHETLYQYPYTETANLPEPWLAADQPKLDKESGKLTIPLRTDLRYADGSSVSAEDFALALKRTQLPSAPRTTRLWLSSLISGFTDLSEKLANAPANERKKILLAASQSVQTVGQSTLVIQLRPIGRSNEFYSRAQVLFTDLWSAPISAASLGDDGLLKNELLFGSGAYRIASRLRGKQIGLERNVFYAKQFYPARAGVEFSAKGLATDAGKPLPQTDRIEVRIARRAAEALSQYEAGQTQSIRLGFDQVKNLRAKPTLKMGLVDMTPRHALEYLFLNGSSPLLSTLEDRAPICRELSSASFKQKWSDAMSLGIQSTTGSLLPPSFLPQGPFGFSQHDSIKAVAKVKKAKVGIDADSTSELRVILKGRGFRSSAAAELLASQLSSLGSLVRIEENDFLDWRDKFRNSLFAISQNALHATHPWPESWLIHFLEIDREATEPVLLELATLPDLSQTRALLERWNTSLLKNCRAIPLSQLNTYLLIHPRVRNVHRETHSYARGQWKYWRI